MAKVLSWAGIKGMLLWLSSWDGGSVYKCPGFLMLAPLTCSLVRENLGPGHDFNKRPLSNSSTFSPPPNSLNSRCNLLFLHYDRCLTTSSWSCTHAGWWKLGLTSLCLLFSYLLLCCMKLWYLWLWTSCSKFGIGRMVSIFPRNCTQYHHHYQPQKSLLCQRPLKTIQTTGQMVPLSPGLQPMMAGHSRNQNGTSRHTLKTRTLLRTMRTWWWGSGYRYWWGWWE